MLVLITLGRVTAWVQPENPSEWDVSEGPGTVSENESAMNINRRRDHQWIKECSLYYSTSCVIWGGNRKLNAKFE